MGERRILSVDFRTGGVEVAFRTGNMSHELPFEERMANLHAEAAEHLPGSGEILDEIMRIACDHCGVIVNLDPAAPRMPPGWKTVAALGDLCPSCAKEP